MILDAKWLASEAGVRLSGRLTLWAFLLRGWTQLLVLVYRDESVYRVLSLQTLSQILIHDLRRVTFQEAMH